MPGPCVLDPQHPGCKEQPFGQKYNTGSHRNAEVLQLMGGGESPFRCTLNSYR